MGLLSSVLERRASLEDPRTPFSALLDAWGLTDTAAGAQVSERNALNLSAFYCGVRVLTDTVAQTPLILYRRLEPEGKERAINHPVYIALHDQPNPFMSPFGFKETLQGHLAVWGNAYAEIDRTRRRVFLWPLLPDRTRPILINGAKWLETDLQDGSTVQIPPGDYLHIPGFGFDGLKGKSAIGFARESLGLTKAAEEFGARFFGNGSTLSGVLSHPGKLGDKASKNLKRSWDSMHQGLKESHRVAVLEEGVTWQSIGVPPEDAQFLGTRKFQVTEIARWLKVQPHKIMDMERSTFSNIEQQNIEFHQDTAGPWFVRWEQGVTSATLSPLERRTLFAEFMADAILRGDSTARGEFYTKQMRVGAMTPNEVRAFENRNPMEGGDQLYIAADMIPLAQAGQDRSTAQRGDVEFGPVKLQPVRYGVQYRALDREGLRDANRGTLEDAARRLLQFEIQRARRAVKAAFRERDRKDFDDWITSFYEDHPATVQQRFQPALLAYAKTVVTGIAAERDQTIAVEEIDRLATDYAEKLGIRWTAESSKQLRALLSEDDPEAALNARLDQWEEKRADKVGRRESMKAGEFFHRSAWVLAGVEVFRWSTVGEGCPLCDSMDGQVVRAEKPFLFEGQGVNVLDEHTPNLTPGTTVRHPPLHDGCDCQVVPG